MQEQSNNSTANTLLAFLAGAAIGGLVVALTTPKSGDDLRSDLKELGNRMKGKAEDTFEKVGSTFQEARQRVGKAASEVKGDLQEAGQDLRG